MHYIWIFFSLPDLFLTVCQTSIQRIPRHFCKFTSQPCGRSSDKASTHMALAAFGWAWSEPNEVTMRLHIEVLLVEWQGIYALWKISPMFPMLHTAQVFAWSLERNTFLLFIQTLTAHFNTLAPEYTLHRCEIEEQTVISNLIVHKMFLAHSHYR